MDNKEFQYGGFNMNFLVIIKLVTSILGLGSIAFGTGAIIGTFKGINPMYQKLKEIDKECQNAEALHQEAEEMLRQMGVSEKDIMKLDQDNLVAYYQIKKKQLDWFVKNKEWLQKMGIKMEDVIPLEYSFEKR